MISVKWGEKTVTRGYVDLPGHTPPICGQKRGDPYNPSCAAVLLDPTTCLEKEKKRCTCSARPAGTFASASELNLGQSGARAGASRGRVWPIPLFD